MGLASHPSTATGHRGRPGRRGLAESPPGPWHSCLQPGVDRRPRVTRGAGLRTHGDSHAASPRPSVPSLGPGSAVSAATSEHLSQRPAVPGPGGAAVLACVSHRHVPLGREGALSCDRRSAGKGVLGVPRPWALRSVATRPWSPRWRHSRTRPADAHTGCPVPGRHRRVGAREQTGRRAVLAPPGRSPGSPPRRGDV